MSSWTGVVLALPEPGAGTFDSRLPASLHPLAGRPLVWHAVQAAALLAPGRVSVVGGPELAPDLFGDLPGGVRVVDEDAASDVLRGSGGAPLLAVDGLAPTVGRALARLVEHDGDALLVDGRGEVLAAWLTPQGAARLAEAGGRLAALPDVLPAAAHVSDPSLFAVRSRADLARAAAAVRDEVVARLMERGATFLLPESVLVDVDVTLGRDTVVYPGVVIEGASSVGAETVIGPGCRIISTRIGSGAELKGFNYVSHTSIRNRAILEAYVRRGFDP